ncbi:MAG TPA: hypothetical protein VEB39_09560, partial [Sphingomicrobium sp.]|nr:hypothetical protein [Sphingomicrobium sp.]
MVIRSEVGASVVLLSGTGAATGGSAAGSAFTGGWGSAGRGAGAAASAAGVAAAAAGAADLARLTVERVGGALEVRVARSVLVVLVSTLGCGAGGTAVSVTGAVGASGSAVAGVSTAVSMSVSGGAVSWANKGADE